MALQLFKIADVTVATPQTDVEFTSIPQGYTDLMILISNRSTEATEAASMAFTVNGSTSGYSNKNLYGTGSSVGSYSNNYTDKGYSGITSGNTTTSNTFGNILIYCPNYAGSNNKSFSIDTVMENNATLSYQVLNATLWSNTAAITSIKIFSVSGQHMAQSVITLYGIL